MSIIYKITGQIPLQGHLDNATLSLLHNVWANSKNPLCSLVIESAKDKEGQNTWSREVTRVLKQYKMPNIETLLELECPSKESWKK